jgi:hypothetical protein
VLAELTYTQSANISYSLQNGVTGMKVDPQTGVITWTPTAPGTYSVYLKTQNTAANESSYQTWNVEVTSGASSVPQRMTTEETSVYPNPASAGINFNFAATAGKYDLAVIDVTGRTVYTSELNAKAGTNHLALDTRSFDPGVYVLRLTNNAEARTIPFSVVR